VTQISSDCPRKGLEKRAGIQWVFPPLHRPCMLRMRKLTR
jgi:hypothetical protein